MNEKQDLVKWWFEKILQMDAPELEDLIKFYWGVWNSPFMLAFAAVLEMAED